MPKQRGDRLQLHATADRLGRQGVPELVGVHVSDPGGVCGGFDGVVDASAGDGSAAAGEEQRAVGRSGRVESR